MLKKLELIFLIFFLLYLFIFINSLNHFKMFRNLFIANSNNKKIKLLNLASPSSTSTSSTNKLTPSLFYSTYPSPNQGYRKSFRIFPNKNSSSPLLFDNIYNIFSNKYFSTSTFTNSSNAQINSFQKQEPANVSSLTPTQLELYNNALALFSNELTKDTKQILLSLVQNNKLPDLNFLKLLKTSNTICFDVDSTVVNTEGLDELSKKFGKYSEIQKITNTSMNGKLNFYDSFQMRLNIIKPDYEMFYSFAHDHKYSVNKDCNNLILLLKHLNKKIFFISGGIKDIIMPVSKELKISPSRIFSNELLFNQNSDYSYNYFNNKIYTCYNNGKALTINHINLMNQIKRYTVFNIFKSLSNSNGNSDNEELKKIVSFYSNFLYNLYNYKNPLKFINDLKIPFNISNSLVATTSPKTVANEKEEFFDSPSSPLSDEENSLLREKVFYDDNYLTNYSDNISQILTSHLNNLKSNSINSCIMVGDGANDINSKILMDNHTDLMDNIINEINDVKFKKPEDEKVQNSNNFLANYKNHYYGANSVIGYGGIAERDIVKEKSNYYVNQYEDLIKVIRLIYNISEEEYNNIIRSNPVEQLDDEDIIITKFLSSNNVNMHSFSNINRLVDSYDQSREDMIESNSFFNYFYHHYDDFQKHYNKDPYDFINNFNRFYHDYYHQNVKNLI